MAAPDTFIARAQHAASLVRCTRAEAVAVAGLAVGVLAALALLWMVTRPAGGTAAPPPEPGGPSEPGQLAIDRPELVVHVTGHVTTPGLHRLPPDARVADAIDAAGGATGQAQLDALNLARPLSDGEQLHVPSAEETSPPSASTAPSASKADGTLDLNRATAAELEELPGIGPVLAGRIVEHRETHGPFPTIGDLRQVQGVGEKTFQSLVDLLSV